MLGKNILLRICNYAVVSRESSVLIIGGTCQSVYSTRVAKYTLDKWTEVGNLQKARNGPRAILNGDRMYVVGGAGIPNGIQS